MVSSASNWESNDCTTAAPPSMHKIGQREIDRVSRDDE
jgi:hypothetical protein